MPTTHTPMGVLWQKGPLEWIHLPVTPRKTVTSSVTLVALVISKGCKHSKEIIGRDVSSIIVPYNNEQLTERFSHSEVWQILLIDFTGQILYDLPSHPL